jgi:hypothetical protein
MAVNDLNSLIKEGKIMEAFEKYYGEDVTIHENGNDPVEGKEENRKRGINFLWEIDEVYDAEIISVTLGKDVSMTEWAIDVKTKEGVRKKIYRVNVQYWKSGKISTERLYFCKS